VLHNIFRYLLDSDLVEIKLPPTRAQAEPKETFIIKRLQKAKEKHDDATCLAMNNIGEGSRKSRRQAQCLGNESVNAFFGERNEG
jgi:hypothetical protein